MGHRLSGLALAAFLTAFYTMRQIGLTFLGKARTEGAEHAPESVGSMTWPLLLITPFAIVLGFIGIPEQFPVFGGVVPNWIEHSSADPAASKEFYGRLFGWEYDDQPMAHHTSG